MAQEKVTMDGQEVIVDYEEGDAGIDVSQEDLSDAPRYSEMMEEGESLG